MRLTGSADAADDLLQATALKALEHGETVTIQAARIWLFRVMRNAWIDTYRRNLIREASPLEQESGVESWRFDDALIARMTVEQALKQIDPAQRELIALVDIAGFSYTEAADIVGIPVGTVMSRLSRGRLALLQSIARQGQEPKEQ